MPEKSVRTDIRTAPELKAAYDAACKALGTTMSEDVRAHMERTVKGKEDAEKGRAA